MDRSQPAHSIKLYVFGAVMLIAVSAAVGYFHVTRSQEIGSAREARMVIAALGPRIEVVATERGPSQRPIKLLGDVRSNATTTLYGKVSGYIKAISADKGDRVEAGQVVAE